MNGFTPHHGHHTQVFSMHDLGTKFSHLVHSENFWVAVFVIGFFAVLVALMIWAVLTGQANGNVSPRPFYPYY